jgi:hypothetical protein
MDGGAPTTVEALAAEAAELRKALQLQRDLEEIRQLKYAYCRANDGGWPESGPAHMGPTADLFVEDGVWDGRPVAPLAEGREAIRRMIVDYRTLAPFALHLMINPDIVVEGDIARGRWRALVATEVAGGASAMLIAGAYTDVYVRTPEGWRFKSLRFEEIRRFALTEAPPLAG